MIKYTVNLFFSLILYSLLSTSFSEELSTQQCEEIHEEIKAQTSVTLSNRLKLWEKSKYSCSSHGVYQKNLIDYYVAMEDYENARKIADDALKNSKNIDKSVLKVILSYSAGLDMVNPTLRTQAREKIHRIIQDYGDLYEAYVLMGFLEFSEKNFNKSISWHLKAISETNDPVRLARAYGGLTSDYYMTGRPMTEVLNTFKKSWDFDRGRALIDDVACHAVVLAFLAEKNPEEAKFILNMQQKYIESIEHNENFLASKKAIDDYEKTLKTTNTH